MTLIAIIGTMGSGKTLTQTYLLWKQWFAKGGKIYANYHLYKIPYMFVGSLRTFNSIKEGFFGGDELWLNADAREHKLAKIFVTNTLARSRKRGLTIYYTVQLLDTIDKRIKKVTDFTAVPQLNVDETICKVMFFRTTVIKPATYMRTLYFVTEPVFQMYDTNEEVVPWAEDENQSTYPEDGKIIFQEDKNSPMKFFNTWEEANEYAYKWYDKSKFLEKFIKSGQI
ncbi:MAG: hypothetical protein ACPLXS_02880 [Candidatus Micrarchaeales archaeon]|jgi:hypothetical protein